MNDELRDGWSDDSQSYLEAFRDDVQADVDTDAAWRRFEVNAGEAPNPRRRPMLWWAGTAAAVAAAAVVLWLVSPSALVELQHDEPGEQVLDEVVEGETEVAPAPSRGPRLVPRASDSRDVQDSTEAKRRLVDDAEVSRVDTSGEQGAAQPRRRRPRISKSELEPSSETGPADVDAVGPSRLEAELKLLNSMRTASKAGRHADALSFVRTHTKTFAQGAFAAERELTRVRALCGLGRLKDARTAQTRFATAFPGSHLGTLVRGACSPTTQENSKSDHDG